MKNKINWIIFLVLLLTLLSRWFIVHQFGLESHNQEFVANKIKTAFQNQLDLLEPWLQADNKTTIDNLGELSSDVKFPFFIYDNDSLIYWQKGRWVPDYQFRSTADGYNYIENSYGTFLVFTQQIKQSSSRHITAITYLPLYQKYGISNYFIYSGVNSLFATNNNVQFSKYSENAVGYPVYFSNAPLFLINLKKGYKPSVVVPVAIIDSMLLLLILVLFIRLLLKSFYWQTKYEILLLVTGWALFKMVLPQLKGVTYFVPLDIFDPQYYAVSWFEQSLGDLLINTIFITILSFRIRIWFRNKTWLKYIAHPNNRGQQWVLLLMLFVVSFWVLNYPFIQLRSIYENSQVSIDITSSIRLSWLRATVLFIVILVNFSTFLLYHVVIRLALKFTKSTYHFSMLLGAATIAFLVLTIPANMPTAHLWWLNIGIIFCVRHFNLASTLQYATYKRFFYLVGFYIILAGANTEVILMLEKSRRLAQMEAIVNKKMSFSDPFAEYLLSSSLTDISEDPFIISRFSSPFLAKQSIVSKVTSVFLNSYLSAYNQKVTLFNAKGNPFKNIDHPYNLFQKLSSYGKNKVKTEYPSVFRINEKDRNFGKHYLGYATIKNHTNVVGYVLVELTEKQFYEPFSHSSLVIDSEFSYGKKERVELAYYNNNKLVSSTGGLSFPNNFSENSNASIGIGNTLYYTKKERNRAIIAAYPWDLWTKIRSNFSFTWFYSIFPVFILWVVISWVRDNFYTSLSYTERIIWYLNLAFLLPLLVVTSATFRFLVNSFEETEQLEKTIMADRLGLQISDVLERYNNGKTSLDNLIKRVDVLADNEGVDLHVFGLDGKLMCSSQPSVFYKKLQSNYADYGALKAIEHHKNHIINTESIAKLTYNNVYAGIKSVNTGNVLGLLSIPFFEDSATLENNKIEAFNTIINVFIAVLLITILITYFVGKWLTGPLNIVRDSIRSIDFASQTEPIKYKWSDELGMLIKAYNQMLISLEESRHKLAVFEKEKAWREAAQQVAHEIKNPLTPMKLTLQKLDSKIANKKVVINSLEPSIKSLLQYVETLNNIASSFSEYAKMPNPQLEKVEINGVVIKAIGLFAHDEFVKIKLHQLPQNVYSLADNSLLLRILNNLIINAKQSIRKGQNFVQLDIETKIVGQIVQIQFKDNGMGIDESLYDKVFQPKFTTKRQGSGIGLAMAKQGIERMQGQIYFSSNKATGTCFTINLPLMHL